MDTTITEVELDYVDTVPLNSGYKILVKVDSTANNCCSFNSWLTLKEFIRIKFLFDYFFYTFYSIVLFCSASLGDSQIQQLFRYQ